MTISTFIGQLILCFCLNQGCGGSLASFTVQELSTFQETLESSDDPAKVPRIEFDRHDLRFDFGTISSGDHISKTLPFKNIGTAELLIKNIEWDGG